MRRQNSSSCALREEKSVTQVVEESVTEAKDVLMHLHQPRSQVLSLPRESTLVRAGHVSMHVNAPTQAGSR